MGKADALVDVVGLSLCKICCYGYADLKLKTVPVGNSLCQARHRYFNQEDEDEEEEEEEDIDNEDEDDNDDESQ